MSDNNSQAYRREADHLLSLITALTDEGHQLELFQMARQYVKMAERAERRERRGAPDPQLRQMNQVAESAARATS